MRRSLLLLPLLCPLIATGPEQPPAALDFRYDILPLLHRQGCGSAYCHGSATGRGGFKLSLFASDPAADHAAITRELGGRRIDLRQPEHSLLLRKPSLQTDHGGGRRLDLGSPAHRTLKRWIAGGARYTGGPRRELRELRLSRHGDRLRAIATFAVDGVASERDVTGLCTFRSSDDRVCAVDETGSLRPGMQGEAWLFARYVNRSARLPVVQRFAAAPAVAAGSTHPLDRLWLQRLDQLGLRPAPAAPPTTLARRLYLDLAGRGPTPAELQRFLELPAATRVRTTAEALVGTGDFAERFGRHLASWLEIPLSTPDRPNPRTPMFEQQHRRLVQAVAQGDSLHRIAERLIVEDRSLLDRLPDPRDRAELGGRAFLGIRIGCARCHNSPVDRWEQRDHLAFSALFVDPRPDPSGGMRAGILFDPDTGAPVEPRILPVSTAAAEAAAPPRSRREDHGRQESPRAGNPRAVADFVLHGGHRMFARNVANRTFAALMGRGLVTPTDDHRLSNPAVHEPLLNHLADRASDGDLRRLVLHIVTTRMYQADSRPAANPSRADAAAVQYFARRESRALAPAVFANTVARALDVPAPEELTESPLARQLALLNSDFLHGAVARSPALRTIADFAPDAKNRLRDLFVLLLAREPRSEEVAAFLPAVEDDQGLRDLAFALLTSREFGAIR